MCGRFLGFFLLRTVVGSLLVPGRGDSRSELPGVGGKVSDNSEPDGGERGCRLAISSSRSDMLPAWSPCAGVGAFGVGL